MALTGDDQRLEDRGALTGFRVPDEQPVLLPDARRAKRIFHQIIIQAGLSMIEMCAEWRPLSEQIVTGFSDQGFGQYAVASS